VGGELGALPPLDGEGPAEGRGWGDRLKFHRRRLRISRLSLLVASTLLLTAASADAQNIDLGSLAGQMTGTNAGTIVQLFGLLTVLSLAPGILIMVTSFTRFIIAFSILRSGMGLQTTPANIVLVSLALFMTFYVMTPAFDQAWKTGVKPLMDNQITEEVALQRISSPFRVFMLRNVRPKDYDLFADLARERGEQVASRDTVDLRILIPAFMISEIRRGFEIGFLIVLPFLVIDLVVATITMSMGMMMLPPTVLSLPFKIMFFVLIDGWNLLVGSLVRSFS
jgi:flagellar biosynthetic protein FliP